MHKSGHLHSLLRSRVIRPVLALCVVLLVFVLVNSRAQEGAKAPIVFKDSKNKIAGWLNKQPNEGFASSFPPGATIAVAFDQGIAKGDGPILIRNVDGGSPPRILHPKLVPEVTVKGNLLLINLQNHPLEPGTKYEVRLLDGAVVSLSDPAVPFAEGEVAAQLDFSDASRFYLTTSAELIMKIIPLRHAWVGTRALGTEFGTPSTQDANKKTTLSGIETILGTLLGVKIELKGSGSEMKSIVGDADDPFANTSGSKAPPAAGPVPPFAPDWEGPPDSTGPDPLGFGLTPLPDVFEDEPPIRLRRGRPIDPSAGREIPVPPGYMKKAIFADVDRNAIIIVDTRERIEEIEAIIAKLDRPQLLVEISVAILDVSDEARFDWESEFLVKSGAGIGALRTTDSVSQYASTLGSSGAGHPAVEPVYLTGGGFTLNTVLAATRGDAFQIASHLRTLEIDGQAQVLSRPSLLTLNNQDATLTETVTFYVPVTGQINTNLIPVKSGTTIQILPHVVEMEGQERRAIDLLVDITEGAPAGASVEGIQGVGQRRIQTQAVVRENESLLIAGSYQHVESRSQGALPVLGKIPILGLAFKDKAVTQSKRQRMFLITPKVLEADVQQFSRKTERAIDLHQPEGAREAGLELNRANEAQVQNALSAGEATGVPKPRPFSKLRRALHTQQNP